MSCPQELNFTLGHFPGCICTGIKKCKQLEGTVIEAVFVVCGGFRDNSDDI